VKTKISSYFFFILLLIAVVAVLYLFLPFITPLILAAAVAVILYPFYRGVSDILGQGTVRNNLASFITMILFLIIVLVPLFFIVANIYSEIQSIYGVLTDEGGRSQAIQGLNAFSQAVSDRLFNIFPAYSFDEFNITEYFKSALEWIFANLDTIFSSLTMVIGYGFVFLLALFYFLRDGRMIMRRFVSWSPLLDTHDVYIASTMKRAIQSVFAGTIVVAIIQGILTGVGFYIFGIPAATVWGSVAAVAAFIPGIGTSLVIVPGIIYLFVTGNYMYGLGLLVWGFLAVGLIDNLLGPFLINRGMNVHPFLILISVLGGLVAFGAIGFVLGPLILAFVFALLEIYRHTFPENVTNNN
jgi:predicted PurR-regulated permease PerM